MTAGIAQTIALVSYGNQFLDTSIPPQDMLATNSTFQFCDSVHFFDVEPWGAPRLTGTTVYEWLEYLHTLDCKRLVLRYVVPPATQGTPARKLEGFANGGSKWIIEVVCRRYSMLMTSTWHANPGQPQNNRPWSVTYGPVDLSLPPDPLTEVAAQKAELRSALTNISAFAQKQGDEYWVNWFRKGLYALDSPTPNNEFYHKDLIPASYYAPNAEQLLFAAAHGWVFAGMGSWNDTGFRETAVQQQYEDLSEQLYRCVIRSLLTAVNTVTA